MSKLKAVGAKISKFFSCVPGEVWVHMVTLVLVCTILGVIIGVLTNPEFAKMALGLLLICGIIGMTLYMAYHLYRMIFEFICDFLDNWLD